MDEIWDLIKSVSEGIPTYFYTMMKGRETFFGDHTVPVTSCSEVHYVL